ncbi:MAG: tyrosine-type recombinase/integrase [Burkholderiales bacterium]|nr:tyrosine-type recombinase/integrase [Burkholderiales bacterium]
MRGYVQGLDMIALWDRYLNLEGDATDARIVKSTLRWIRQALALVALREGKHSMARVMRLDVTHLESVAEAPTLDEFIEEQGIEDLRESEQIEAWAERWGTPSKRERTRMRIMERQLAALRELEALAAQKPQAQDRVRAWLPAAIANRLEAQGVMTLAGLVTFINAGGRGWWRKIPGIGETKAGRLVTWLVANSLELGASPSEYVTGMPPMALADAMPATAIIPLERVQLTSALDGSTGLYRQRMAHCMFEADNDLQAIHVWLAEYRGHTLRSYRREAERFLLWSVVARGKPLSSMTREDVLGYVQFLHDPQPAAQWCAPRSRPRSSSAWRPFEGPLGDGPVAFSVRVIGRLMQFLVDQGYLVANAAAGIRANKRPSLRQQFGSRRLSAEQWRMLRDGVGQGDGLRERRLGLILDFLYTTGLRISELAAARFTHLQRVSDEDGVPGWMLAVLGKGAKWREVPVPDHVVETALALAQERGASWDGASPESCGAHMIGAIAGRTFGERPPAAAGITTAAIAAEVRRHVHAVADRVRAHHPHDAQRIEQASVHWLRHTHVSHSLENGADPECVRENVGHASLATTSIYASTEQRKRLAAMRRVWAKVAD